MPRSTQIMPEHSYPSQTVVINDNSAITTVSSSDSGSVNMLFVVNSPRGIDRKVRTITGGLAQLLREYGDGPASVLGQPWLNAKAALGTGVVTGHVLRVSAADAAYPYINIMAKYKVDVTTKAMTVKLSTASGASPLTDLANLESTVTPAPDADAEGFTEVKLLSVAYKGRCKEGNKNLFRISSLSSADRANDYKNYVFEAYENYNGLTQVESFNIAFPEDAIVDGVSIYSDAVVNDPSSGSSRLVLISYAEGFAQIVNAYIAANPTTELTINDFDVLLGINKYSKTAITNYTIDTTAAGTIAINDVNCISLANGSDGSFDVSTDSTTRTAAIEAAYTAALSGTTDPMIKSKNKFPTNLILDANYSVDNKKLLAALGTARGDGVVIIDCGLGITTKAAVATYVSTNLDSYVSARVHMVDAYAGQIRDPYNNKIVSVTSTYRLATMYPTRFANNNYAKHVPVAGNVYGILTGFIEDTIYPVFDEDIDSALMDELAEANVNFARLNAAQRVIRATQATRQDYISALSEGNAVFVLLDIKRDCEQLCANYEYNFNETADIAKFNKDVSIGILPKYSEAQVRTIEAAFSSNAFEAARGILHLNVALVNKDIVKHTIIEIDVNRATE